MKFGDALKVFAEKKIKQYVLFCGEEEYLKTSGLQALLGALDISTPELNISYFEERPDMGAVAAAMETLPFMSERRAIVIKNTDILSTACAAAFTEAINGVKMPDGCILIICARGKADKRKALYKKIAGEGIVVDCEPFSEAELSAYAVNAAFQSGLILSRDNAQKMAEYCGGDLSTLINELNKLASVCVGNISKEDIAKYVSRSAQYNVFKIHDLLCAGRLADAKVLIDRTLADDPSPMGLISMISGNFKQMLVARACMDAKFAPAKVMSHVMEETGAKEWAAKRAVQNGKSYTAARLRKGIYLLGRMDFMAKQGEVVLKTDLFPLLAEVYAR